jgi:hypothetical protein
MRPIMNEIELERWERQVNALIDGELNDQEIRSLNEAAATSSDLAGMLKQARLLQALTATLPERVPREQLSEKLLQIPQRRARRWIPWATAASLVVALSWLLADSYNQTRELAQARQDMSIAMHYLRQATGRTHAVILASVAQGFKEPVHRNAVEIISDQLSLTGD